MPTRPVSEVIQHRPVVTASMATTVSEAARIMKECRSSALLVVSGPTLAGICTERDIVFGAVAAGLDPHSTPVAAIMTRNVQTIAPHKPFGHALHMMYEGGFRHVPVVDGAGRPLGLLAAHDALSMDMLQLEGELERREELAVIL